MTCISKETVVVVDDTLRRTLRWILQWNELVQSGGSADPPTRPPQLANGSAGIDHSAELNRLEV